MKTRLKSAFRDSRYRGSIAASITNFVLLLCVAVLLTACNATSVVLEPQNRQLNAGMARIFFIRHSSFLSGLGKPDIKVDDKLVGSLAVGSYFVVDRPPGPHRIAVHGALDSTGWQTSLDLLPGTSYYLELGPVVRRNIDGFRLESMDVTGQPLPGRPGLNSAFMFYVLDPSAGAAVVARLTARSS
ncbi:hypothetical protein V1291_002985 [Nitrobacteraceae bacterium AZCC 1564]